MLDHIVLEAGKKYFEGYSVSEAIDISLQEALKENEKKVNAAIYRYNNTLNDDYENILKKEMDKLAADRKELLELDKIQKSRRLQNV